MPKWDSLFISGRGVRPPRIGGETPMGLMGIARIFPKREESPEQPLSRLSGFDFRGDDEGNNLYQH